MSREKEIFQKLYDSGKLSKSDYLKEMERLKDYISNNEKKAKDKLKTVDDVEGFVNVIFI